MAKLDKRELFKNFKKVSEETTNKARNLAGNAKDLAGTVAQTASVAAEKAAQNAGNVFNETSQKINKAIEEGKEKKESKNDELESKEEINNLDDLLRMATDEYNAEYTKMYDYGMNLYVERERAKDVCTNIENLINSIANHPKSFDTDMSEIKMNREEFQNSCDFAKQELDAARKSAISTGGGLAAGATVASVAPATALWIATTFGTASTGTAISTLSGAAASNAALAWLGGGAIAAGGQGMAAGSALLAMAGPVGWSIAGATLLTSIVLFTRKKMRTNKERKEEIERVKLNTEMVIESGCKIKSILDKTNSLREELNSKYCICLSSYEKSFLEISDEQKMELGALVNNTKALAVTLGENI
jgi:hypothetical protein